jgi:ZIP family zinc transporter
MLLQIIFFALVPALAIFSGGTIASFWPPDKKTQSFVQHFAAGVVFAALVGEVLPDLTSKHPSPIWVIVGFAVGVGLMLVMRWAIEKRLPPGKIMAEDPTTLIIVGIDVLIDGLLIGIGISLGEINGVLLTVALAIEILFLGLSTGAEMIESGRKRKDILRTLLILAVPPIVGVFAGGYLFVNVSQTFLIVVLSFAAAALLYLVTEELLMAAHEIEEKPIATLVLFGGFLTFWAIQLMGH